VELTIFDLDLDHDGHLAQELATVVVDNFAPLDRQPSLRWGRGGTLWSLVRCRVSMTLHSLRIPCPEDDHLTNRLTNRAGRERPPTGR